MKPRILVATMLVLGGAAELRAQCTGPNHVVWPAVNPVWDFCWKRPSQSTPQPNGAGIEITDVKYRNVTILKQGHIPILNVKYVPGGCGVSANCYRDWFDGEQAFSCAPNLGGGYCTGTTTPATTVCQHPGSDAGSFNGVAVEDLGDHLKLTGQCGAGWYRYIPIWEFYLDGTIKARIATTAVPDGCVAFTHHHHAYFRFDFDVDGVAANFVDYFPPGGGAPQRVTTETNYVDTGANRSKWNVGRTGSSTLVQIYRNPEDEAAGDPSPVPNDFPIADGWVVAYHPTEITDPNGQTGNLGACPAQLNNFLNGESVNGADVVLWARGGAVHIGEPGGVPTSCDVFGPTIKVLNPTPVELEKLEIQ